MEPDTKPNFTPRAQQALKFSKDLARSSSGGVVSAEHLVVSLFSQSGGILHEVVSALDFNSKKLKQILLENLNKREDPAGAPCVFSEDVENIIRLAQDSSIQFDHNYIGVEHLFLGVVSLKKTSLLKTFLEFDLDLKEIATKIKLYFTDATQFAEYEEINETPQNIPTPSPKSKEFLEKYGVNYNALALQGKFSKLVLRETEISQLCEVLCCKTKNSPLLLGDPGVGKTALIEGLSQRVVEGVTPDFLLSAMIYGIDLPSMVAGTKYRGQFEERLKGLIKEVKSDPNIILFIDELHTLVGAGSAEGSMDAANILKPMLARGEIRCIGATTFKEYKKNIEKDGALSRRFKPITVEEPSSESALKILEGVCPSYEKFHSVKFPLSSLKKIIDLSVRYIKESALPDKALDILDQAASKCKIENFRRPQKAQVVEKKIEILMNHPDSPEAHEITEEVDDLFEEYKDILNDWGAELELTEVQVEDRHIYEVISDKTGVPVGQLSQTQKGKLLNLPQIISNHVVGQDHAIKPLADTMLRNSIRLTNECRPLGSFLFLGPSGVGKTYLAKVLAREIFGNEKNLIHIDMSEYSEKTNASRLTGAAPGYVGFDEAGQLTEQVRKKPYSVILFDEIEKAHPDVILLLLQILEEGRLTDNVGKAASFENCIIIATGNFGSELLSKKTMTFGGATEEIRDPEDLKGEVIDAAKKFFKPEFVNRLDEIVLFKNHSLSTLRKICKIELTPIEKSLKERGVTLKVSPSAINLLAQETEELKFGCRPLKKIIRERIETPIARLLLTGSPSSIQITSKNKKINIKS